MVFMTCESVWQIEVEVCASSVNAESSLLLSDTASANRRNGSLDTGECFTSHHPQLDPPIALSPSHILYHTSCKQPPNADHYDLSIPTFGDISTSPPTSTATSRPDCQRHRPLCFPTPHRHMALLRHLPRRTRRLDVHTTGTFQSAFCVWETKTGRDYLGWGRGVGGMRLIPG